MAVITPARFLEQLRRWDIPHREHVRHDRCANRTVAWSQHEARRLSDCASRGTWDPVGIAVHHSGGPTAWSYVWDGRMGAADNPKVPGPLYVVLVDADGVADLTGWGTSNNVGSCDDGTFNLVAGDRMPLDREVRPAADDYGSANRRIYGLCYRGTTPTAAQRKTMRLLCAALCEAHGWTGRSIAGHREFSTRKPDPEGEQMHELRRDVNALLTAGPGGDDMPLTDADISKIATKVHDTLVGKTGLTIAQILDRESKETPAETLAAIAALSAKVDALAEKVGTPAAPVSGKVHVAGDLFVTPPEEPV